MKVFWLRRQIIGAASPLWALLLTLAVIAVIVLGFYTFAAWALVEVACLFVATPAQFSFWNYVLMGLALFVALTLLKAGE